MTAHRDNVDAAKIEYVIPDPGASGVIGNFQQGKTSVEIVTAAAEARTVEDPPKAGLELVLTLKTDGGTCTVTFDTAYDQSSTTTLVLDDAGDCAKFESVNDGAGNDPPTFRWALIKRIGEAGGDVEAGDVAIADSGALIAATTVEGALAENRAAIDALEAISTADNNAAGAGITGGAASFVSGVERIGDIIKTTIVVDLTGLNSGANANDVIGKADTANCSLGQITAALNGTIFAGRMTCLETPAGGDDDIDLWDAESGTLTEDTDIEDDAGAEDQLSNGGDLTVGTIVPVTAFPTADRYLYLGAGTGDTNDTYTAGILLIELWGK